MLLFFNKIIPYIGLIVCLLLWRLERFNTKPFPIQITLIVWIVAMIMLYLADTNPYFVPVIGSVIGRYLMLLSIITVGWYVYEVTCDFKLAKLKEKISKLIKSND